MMSVSVGLVFPRDLNGQCQAATHTVGIYSGRGVWLLSFGPLFILSLGSDVVVGIVGTVEMCAFVLTAQRFALFIILNRWEKIERDT